VIRRQLQGRSFAFREWLPARGNAKPGDYILADHDTASIFVAEAPPRAQTRCDWGGRP
jgi:hypothetical protein